MQRRHIVISVLALLIAGGIAAKSQSGTRSSDHPYHVAARVTPNVSTSLNTVTVVVSRDGSRVDAARVRLTITMLDMPMGSRTVTLRRTGVGEYRAGGIALGMAGRWGLRYEVTARRNGTVVVPTLDLVPR